jgi:hypothetical protein
MHDAWLKDLEHWRTERRIRIGYDGSRYSLPALQWTQSSFIQPQMMVQDRYFYDPVAGKYTVDRYLDDLEKRYGGIDAVLVWAADRSERLLIVFNFQRQSANVQVDLGAIDGSAYIPLDDGESPNISADLLKVQLPAFGHRIFVVKR